MTTFNCYCDGGYSNGVENSGYCSYKIYNSGSTNIHNRRIPLHHVSTHNEAEYESLYLLLTHLSSLEFNDVDLIHINSDSMLVVNQSTGIWRLRKKSLFLYRKKVIGLLRELESRVQVSLEWAPREILFDELGH